MRVERKAAAWPGMEVGGNTAGLGHSLPVMDAAVPQDCVEAAGNMGKEGMDGKLRGCPIRAC